MKIANCSVGILLKGVQLKMRVALPGASINVVSEPRALATGSCAQLSINSYFVDYFLIRSLPLAVLTRVATITFNYTLLKETTGIQFSIFNIRLTRDCILPRHVGLDPVPEVRLLR